MTTELTKPKPDTIITPRLVERIKTSLPPLQGQYPTNRDEADRVAAALPDLEKHADPQWVAQRAVMLLSHYFVADMHPAALKGIATDWQRELRWLPDWAIEAACCWWISRHNPKRRNKPLPGDISERAHIEAACLTVGRMMVLNYEKYGDHPPSYLK